MYIHIYDKHHDHDPPDSEGDMQDSNREAVRRRIWRLCSLEPESLLPTPQDKLSGSAQLEDKAEGPEGLDPTNDKGKKGADEKSRASMEGGGPLQTAKGERTVM